jgi:histone chaperone ASF1
LQELAEDLEWRVTYVGNAEDASYDQTLEEVLVGPVPVGINRFVLQASAPNHSLIANEDLIGVTVVLISCFYMSKEFVKIGYYVNND